MATETSTQLQCHAHGEERVHRRSSDRMKDGQAAATPTAWAPVAREVVLTLAKVQREEVLDREPES